MRAFRKYKDSWIGIWRLLGHTDTNGSFIPPISFEEAKRMSKKELDIYCQLDDLIAIQQRILNDTK